MTILYMNLAAVFMFALSARFFAVPASAVPALVKPNKLFIFLAMCTFVLISGLRKDIGDTFYYMHAFATGNFTLEFVKSNKDIGFGLLQMLLKQYTNDPQFLVFITALITNVLIVAVLYKYSRLIEMSLYVYITSGLYVVSMNGIRQFLAAAIVFTAIKFIFDGSWFKYILVILLASTIHQSALILIPVYFVVRRKAWTLSTLGLLVLAILTVIGYNQFSGALFDALGNTQYGEYKNFQEGGANVLRVAVAAVPLIVAYLGRHKLREMFPQSDYVVNMSLLGLVFMVIATQNWIFARFTIYFDLYSCILISWVVKLFARKEQRLVYYAILVFYFLYFYYENVISLGLVYKSDFINI